MKKVLLFSLIFLITTISVLAYETIIIKFPQDEVWEKAYYKKVGLEAIVQYVPRGQTHNDWQRAVVVHSYNHSTYPVRVFMGNSLARMEKANPTSKYKYLKLTQNDAIATRCTKNYNGIMGQCEFFRGTYAHGGMISIHYINRNYNDFLNTYGLWYGIIRDAKLYNSYYRDERTFDKSEYVEL